VKAHSRAVGIVLAATALALAGCGGYGDDDEGEGAAATGPSLRTVQIVESDFRLTPSVVTIANPGVYTLHAVNRGQATHALELEGNGIEVETNELGPGESADLKVQLNAGTYELYCPVDSHRDMGMEGSVRVGGGAMGSGTDTSGEGTSTGSSGYSP
jgi:plastocyanin